VLRFAASALLCVVASFACTVPAHAQRCLADKLKASGKLYDCRMKAEAKGYKKLAPAVGFDKCNEKLAKTWQKAETRGDCITSGDESAVQSLVEGMTDALTATIAPMAPANAAAGRCAAGQTKAAGKLAACRLGIHRKNVTSAQPLDFTKCEDKFEKLYLHAEANGGLDCPSTGLVDDVRMDVAGDTDTIALGLSTATTTTTSSTTSTTTSTTTLPLGDDFNGAMLDPSWSVLNPGLVTIDVSGGSLNIEPTMAGAGTTWFNDSEGPLIYKPVTGDFDVRVVISTEDPGNPGNPPPTQYRLAGVLARDPASVPGSLNWVHVALGSGAAAQGTSYEYKSTDESVSTWMTIPTASSSGELRLVRSGATFDQYWRADGISPWTLIQTFVRPDLPATLQVGMMIYSTDAPPSIRASFDEIAFF